MSPDAAVASGWRLGVVSVTYVGLCNVYICGGWTSGRLSSSSTSTGPACGYWSSASGAVACLLRCGPVSGVREVLHLHRRWPATLNLCSLVPLLALELAACGSMCSTIIVKKNIYK